LNDKNPQLFSTEVITEAKQLKQEAVQKQHYEEEDKPFENANPYFTLDDWDDDIPF
jgi:hypothetical protein